MHAPATVVVGQQLCRGPDLPGHIAAGVDDGIPMPTLKGGEIAVAVTAQLLDVGKEIRAVLALVVKNILMEICEHRFFICDSAAKTGFATDYTDFPQWIHPCNS